MLVAAVLAADVLVAAVLAADVLVAAGLAAAVLVAGVVLPLLERGPSGCGLFVVQPSTVLSGLAEL